MAVKNEGKLMKKFVATLLAVVCMTALSACTQADVSEFISEFIGEYPEETYEEYKVENFSEIFGEQVGDIELSGDVVLRLYEDGIAEMVLIEETKSQYKIEFTSRTEYRGNFVEENGIVVSEMKLTQKVVFGTRLEKDIYLAAIAVAMGGSDESGERNEEYEAAVAMASAEGYVLDDEAIEFEFTLIVGDDGAYVEITRPTITEEI